MKSPLISDAIMNCPGEFLDSTKFYRTERVNVNGNGFGVLTMNMEKTVCKEVRHHNHHHVLKIYILKVISINKFNTIFEITIAIFQEADAYECRTGIEEGGVKKTIVVSLHTKSIVISTLPKICKSRNVSSGTGRIKSLGGKVVMLVVAQPDLH